MPEPVEETLGFDISGALQGIGQIDDALQQVVQSFQVGLASALETLTGAGADVTPLAESLDVAGLGPAIDTAITDAASTPVAIEGDTAALDEAVSDALDASRPPVEVEGDTGALVDAIDTATQVSATVPVDADTDQAELAIDALSAVTPVEIPVTADTLGAEAEIEQVGLGVSVDVPVTADTTDAQEEIEQVGLGAEVDVPVTADTTGAQADIDTLAADPIEVPVEAQTTDAAADINALDTPISLSVDADVSAAADAIGALEGETILVDVDADTAGAQDEISGLGLSAGNAASEVADLTIATRGFTAASAVGRGEAGGLTSGLELLGPTATAVAVSAAAGAASLGVFFSQALDAKAAVQRLDASMGPLAARIENLRVGSLNEDLSDLALSLGSDDDALRNIASTLFLFQEGAGTSRIEASKFSETVLALSARAVALNPALGRVEDIAGRLGNTLGRGGRFASAFQLDLQQTDIKARAAENALRGLGDGTSFASLQLAGGQLALEKYGNRLQEDIAQGTKNPILQLAALRQKFEEATEAIGAPLVAPILGLLTDIEPLAESVAAVIGGLGQVAVPVVQALVTALVPVAPLLTGFAVGLGQVAEGLDGIPAPLLAATVGFTALAVAGRAAVTSLVASGIAFAATPFGQAAIVLAGTITALGLLSGQAEDAAVDTTALNTAFGQVSSGGEEVTNTLGGLNRAIEDYLDKQLQIGDVGERAIDATNRLGISNDQLIDALTGADPAFRAFEDGIFTLENGAVAGSDAMKALFETVEGGRDALQAQAAAAVAAAVQNEVLTQSEVERLEAQNKIQISTADGLIPTGTDYIAILEKIAPAVDQAAAAQREIAQNNAAASGSWRQLAVDIAAGNVTTEQAATIAEQLGITTEDATGIIDRQVQALEAQQDAQLRSSSAARETFAALESGAITAAQAELEFRNLGISARGTAGLLSEAAAASKEHEQANTALGLSTGRLQQAFLDLRPAIADGSITAGDAQQVALDLGISLDDAKAAVDSLSEAMDQFVSGGLSALPDAGAAISEFASGIESARSALDNALAAEGDTSGAESIADSQVAANRSISDNAEQTARTLQEAQRKVDEAQANLTKAETEGGKGQEAAIKSAQGKLQTALDGLTRTRETAGQSQADAVRDGSRKVGDAQAEANQQAEAQTAEARAAQDALVAALDPQRVIDAQNRATFAILTFQANLTELLRRGRDNAVAALIAQGPETGGQLAAALVSDDAKAKAFDGGIALANRITTGYGSFLEQHKAELSGRLVTLADGQIVDLTETFSTGGATVGRAFTGGVAQAIDASPEVQDATRRLIEGGAAAFDPNLAASPAKAAGTLAGNEAQAGFTTGFQPDAAATTAIAKVPAAITRGIGAASTAATIAGDQVAAGFSPDFAARIGPAMLSILSAIDHGVTDLVPFVGLEGQALGTAFGQGFAGGLDVASPDVAGAAGRLGDVAVAAIREALGVRSPSTVGVSIGEQFVAGIVQGLEQLAPLQRATAAVALALIPDLTPALKQVPQLAPAIVGASQVAARPAVAAQPASAVPGKNVAVRVDLHKVDVNPKHLADEIAWTIG